MKKKPVKFMLTRVAPLPAEKIVRGDLVLKL